MRENEQRTMKMMTIDALFLVSISFRQLYSNKMGSENVLHYLFIKKKKKNPKIEQKNTMRLVQSILIADLNV